MSEEEPWDAKRVAAECAATARDKVGPKPGDPPPITITSGLSPRDEFATELAAVKGKPGTKTKYRPEFVEQARKLASLGATNVEMADFFEIHIRNFHLWLNVHPELRDAIRVGKERPDERVKRSLYERATGYDYSEEVAVKVGDDVRVVTIRKHIPPDVHAGTLWLTNRRPDEWKLKRTVEHTDAPAPLHPDQARRELAEFMNKGEIIDVTPTRLTLPEPESKGAIIAEDDI